MGAFQTGSEPVTHGQPGEPIVSAALKKIEGRIFLPMTTVLSQKGQVVLPASVRESRGDVEGPSGLGLESRPAPEKNSQVVGLQSRNGYI